MGNLCGKESKDNFAGAGRTVGAPPPRNDNARSSIPASAAAKPKPTVGGPARTLGGGAEGAASATADDARSAAARAAEERAAKAQGTGKLGKALDEQRKKTQTQLLSDASTQQRQQRDADANTEARNWN